MLKKCKKCKKELPKTIEYFYQAYKTGKGNIVFQSKCKNCLKKPRVKKTHKICNICKEKLPATLDYFYRRGDKYLQATCRNCNNIKGKLYRKKKQYEETLTT